MEVVEIAFESGDDRSALPVAAGLTAADKSRNVGRSGSVIADLRGIGRTQISSGIDRRGEVRGAGAAAAVNTDIASRPLIGRALLARLHRHRHVGRDGARSKRKRAALSLRTEKAASTRATGRRPRFYEWNDMIFPKSESGCLRFRALPFPRARWRSGFGCSVEWKGQSQRPAECGGANAAGWSGRGRRTARPSALNDGKRHQPRAP